MKNKIFKVLIAICLASASACSQDNKAIGKEGEELSKQEDQPQKTTPHRYGGWYCPDNLNGFSAVDIADWEAVPVVLGRMPTKEETRSGESLIFVDPEKYPDAKPLGMQLPRLASFNSEYSKRKELIIVIQAINVADDSIVGFRYLNGGNGSARLNEIQFLAENEIDLLPERRFVTQSIQIDATQDAIWEVLTGAASSHPLQEIFNKNKNAKPDWRCGSKVNFRYENCGVLTSSYGEKLFGNFYIQDDYLEYTQKFLLLEDDSTKTTEMKIVCGPYGEDFEIQQQILNSWSRKVKELSERKD